MKIAAMKSSKALAFLSQKTSKKNTPKSIKQRMDNLYRNSGHFQNRIVKGRRVEGRLWTSSFKDLEGINDIKKRLRKLNLDKGLYC